MPNHLGFSLDCHKDQTPTSCHIMPQCICTTVHKHPGVEGCHWPLVHQRAVKDLNPVSPGAPPSADTTSRHLEGSTPTSPQCPQQRQPTTQTKPISGVHLYILLQPTQELSTSDSVQGIHTYIRIRTVEHQDTPAPVLVQ